MRSYLSTSMSNYIVVSCRFDILEGYRVIQFQYRVCKQISPLIPSHPRERIENHSKNNRLYFQANMIWLLYLLRPSPSSSTSPTLSITAPATSTRKFSWLQLTKIKLRFYSITMRTICHAKKIAKEASATFLMPTRASCCFPARVF